MLVSEQVRIDADFARLEVLLKANPLPCSNGHRIAFPDEFMWMYDNSPMGVGFKHRDSRRYVHIQVRCNVDVLVVDQQDMFDVINFDDTDM